MTDVDLLYKIAIVVMLIIGVPVFCYAIANEELEMIYEYPPTNAASPVDTHMVRLKDVDWWDDDYKRYTRIEMHLMVYPTGDPGDWFWTWRTHKPPSWLRAERE